MRYWKTLATVALGTGLALGGTSTLSAADWNYVHHDRQDLRQDSRQLDRLRADRAIDRARLRRDQYWGRPFAATRDRADLARDRHDSRVERRDIREDRQDLRHDWR